MVAIGGIWAPVALRVVRAAAYRASKVIRNKLADAARPVQAALEPAVIRTRQPVHPVALLRQQKSGRWHSTSSSSFHTNINASTRRFISTGRLESAARPDKTRFLGTKIGRAFSQFTGRTPFASTLRPNLTGGALPRTAGGYGLGSGRMGGARFFSHGPASQAHVVQNVSSAVRAFWISGQKAQFDGLNARGEMRFRAVSAKRDEATRKLASFPRHTPGSYIDFRLDPTVTALGPLAAAFPYPSSAGIKLPTPEVPSLNTEGFLDVLSSDFARALKDLTTTLADLHKLALLGCLPVQLEKGGHILRVRFPGVDADTVESLCDDLGLTRGIVSQDPDFDCENGVSVALKFPFAPDAPRAGHKAPAIAPPAGSVRSLDSFLDDDVAELFDGFSAIVEENPWLASSGSEEEGYESMSPPISSGEHCSEDFEGLEGVYRFLEECDRAKGRF